VDVAVARARLERMVQYQSPPVLTSAEIDDLLLLARARDLNGYEPYFIWAPLTVYAAAGVYQRRGDDLVYPAPMARVPTVSNGHLYVVRVAGTSGATEPAWPTASGGEVADGSVIWREGGRYLWTPTFALHRAAAEGWRWKAAKVVDQYDVGLGSGKTFSRDQQIKHCLTMAEQYERGGMGSVALTTGRG
jgi:hypothetical protein